MLKRVISGICLVAITAPALYFGGWFLYALCLVISLVGNFELLRVAGLEKSPLRICGYNSLLYDNAQSRPQIQHTRACGSISCADVGVCIHISKV